MPDRDERHRARIEAERRRRNKAGAKKKRKSSGSKGRRNAVAAAALIVAVGAGAIFALDAQRDDRPLPAQAKATRSGSVESPGAPPVAIERTPSSYRIVYRLEEFTGPTPLLSTDKVFVRRPFESRLDTLAGPPPGKDRATLQVGRFASRRNEGSGVSAAVVIGVPPSAAPSDIRLAPVLDLALGRGLLERREVRTVAGRPCQIYRSGQLLSASAVTAPTAGNHADSCVDAAGLVLEELLTVDGVILSRRIAIEVEEDPVLDEGLFVTGKRTLEAKDGGGLVRRMADGLPPGEFLVFDPASIPPGFERLGRFNVIPSQPENFGDPQRAGARETSFADVFVRGTDFLVIDQGGTLQGTDPYLADPAALTVELGAYGTGEVRLSALGLEVRVKRSGGRFLRIRGTLSPEELAGVARALTPTEGAGPLEFFEEPGSETGEPR